MVKVGGGGQASTASTFEALWRTLVGVLGTGATAALIRRAARGAIRARPDLTELAGFDVVRDHLDYKLVLPPLWTAGDDASFEALRYLVHHELTPLLEELTGPVVIGMLRRDPALVQSGLFDEPRTS